ncbi:TRAP transporter large permease [Sediminispirochaeta bajacaliforniensis]|uniref:TRAP transporter large permease n=1 Tax=Sediminispirochaeta bajacaliforniensis TaxID=148 RepID=UPI00035C88E1|nr:TRAP transporter large permease subunit [Sediminispirochaeta bajacaliforniensis]
MRRIERVVSYISGLSILLLVALPVSEILLRLFFSRGITASSDYITHLVLILTFLGGIAGAINGDHLSISAVAHILKGRKAFAISLAGTFISVAVSIAFAWTSLSMLLIAFGPDAMVGVIPTRLIILIMPLGYLFMAFGFISRLIGDDRCPRPVFFCSVTAIVCGTLLALPAVANLLAFFPVPLDFIDTAVQVYYNAAENVVPLLLILFIFAAFLGVPLFVVLGGGALLLFAQSFGSLEVVPIESYSMLTAQTIAAIPLFTVAGFVLSESGAGERLIALFHLLFRGLPGGMAAVAVIVCAFFTTFTGASGVTILALGGLLSVILRKNGFDERFVDGLLTGSGSIGLLFPPSLPIILYGVVAQISIRDMFLAGIIPGVIMVVMVSFMGFRASSKGVMVKESDHGPVLRVIGNALWEGLLPLVVLVPYLTGIATIVETGAVTLLYALIVEMCIHRDISLRRLPSVLVKSVPIIGGVLIILASSRGLAYYIVDAEIPMKLAAWMEAHISSRLLFLLLLNIGLLITGCLMDIFSAIMVVVPLILPLGELFGVHPVHLGIIFLANLELGYLTPPVGLNLFLASYRFGKPLPTIYRSVLPFFLVMLVAVLLITYIPALSLIFVGS